MKKILTLFFIILFIYLPIISLADDYTEEYYADDSSIAISVSSDVFQTPVINAKHAIVLDRASKTILFGKNENDKCKMASTTKIMTAIIVIENSDLNDTVIVSKKAASIGGSRLGLLSNDKISVKNLLYGLLLRSGNDAAVALAEYVGGSIENFANMMNEKASSLGLKSTHFVTPHGLDNDEHYTTAYELSLITDYALKNDIFSKIVGTTNYTIDINGNFKQLHNTNELLGSLNGVYGVKTGFTNGANRCLVTSCKRNNLDIICVVLGSDTKKDRTLDSIKLINYTFNNFSVINLVDFIKKDFESWKTENSKSFSINKGTSSELNLHLNISQIPYENIAISNSSVDNIKTNISFRNKFEAPLAENTTIGRMDILIDNKNYFSIDIITQDTISKKSIIFYFKNFIQNYFYYLNNNFRFKTYII